MISIQQHLAKNRADVLNGSETVLVQFQLSSELGDDHIKRYFPGRKVGDWVNYSRTTVEDYLNYRESGMRAVDFITGEEINMDSHYDKYSNPVDVKSTVGTLAQRVENLGKYLTADQSDNYTWELTNINELVKVLTDLNSGV